jgi:hypothetical protein
VCGERARKELSEERGMSRRDGEREEGWRGEERSRDGEERGIVSEE